MPDHSHRSQKKVSTDLSGTQQAAIEGWISPELVAVVADKVYAMLLREMEIERERFPRTLRIVHRSTGGR